MNKTAQSGIIHIFLIITLLIGLIAGLYLLSQKTSLFSKAFQSEESVDSLTSELVKLNSQTSRGAQDTSRIPQMLALAQKRKEKLIAGFESNPDQAIQEASLVNSRDSFPEEVRSLIETQGQAAGDFKVVHTDDFHANSSKTIYTSSDDKKVTFYDFDPGVNANLAGLVLSGVELGDHLLVSGKSLEQSTSRRSQGGGVEDNDFQDSTQKVEGTKKIAAIIVKVNEASRPSLLTKDQVEDILFKTDKSLKEYYRVASGGALNLEGEVFDPVILPQDKGPKSACDDYSLYSGAAEVIKDRGIDLSKYNFKFFIFDIAMNCDYGGMALGDGIAYITQGEARIQSTYAHELGHLLNLAHASFNNCKGRQVDSNQKCKHDEYGDLFDTMGQSANFNEFNAPHKIKLGWIDKKNVKVLKYGESATVNLELPLENESGKYSDGYQTVVIPGKSDGFYFLEMRKNISKFDFDLPDPITQGLLISYAYKYGFGSPTNWVQTFLIDSTPESPSRLLTGKYSRSTLADAALADGLSFIDPLNGITIKQLSHAESNVQVEINYAPITVAVTPTTRPNLVKGWLIKTQAICPNKTTVISTSSPHDIRTGFLVWPTVSTSLNQELPWRYTTFAPTNNFSVTTLDDINNVYLKVEDREGNVLEPYQSNLSSDYKGPTGISFGKYFNPPTWMVKWNRVDIPATPLEFSFKAPPSWCGG